MVREAFQLTDWTALRLERARADARSRDDAAAWRHLRDLAAACGLEDEARAAAAHLDAAPSAPPTSRRRRKAARAGAPELRPTPPPASEPAPVPSHEPPSSAAPAPPLRCVLRIRSATPKARRAWLIRLLALRGATVIASDVDTVRADVPGALLAELEAHAELDIRRAGESA